MGKNRVNVVNVASTERKKVHKPAYPDTSAPPPCHTPVLVPPVPPDIPVSVPPPIEIVTVTNVENVELQSPVLIPFSGSSRENSMQERIRLNQLIDWENKIERERSFKRRLKNINERVVTSPKDSYDSPIPIQAPLTEKKVTKQTLNVTLNPIRETKDSFSWIWCFIVVLLALQGCNYFNVTVLQALFAIVTFCIITCLYSHKKVTLSDLIQIVLNTNLALSFDETTKKETVDPILCAKSVTKLGKLARKLQKSSFAPNRRGDGTIVRLKPQNAEKATNFNYKIPVLINGFERKVFAEIDSDSHLNLIQNSFYETIAANGPVKMLDETPTIFSGLGSRLKSKLPPVMLDVQVGDVVISARFVVTDDLTSSPVLLGTDFLVKNKIGINPHEDNTWSVSVGPLSNPTAVIPCLVTNRISAHNQDEELFEPFEVKKIKISGNLMTLNPDTYLHIKNGVFPFLIETVCNKSKTAIVTNLSPLHTTLPPYMPITNISLDMACKAQMDFDLLRETCDTEEDFNSVEFGLEPGHGPNVIVDKTVELDFIRSHAKIPENCKQKLIDCLEKYPDLYSGTEFSEKHFPSEVFSHNVELNAPLTELVSRPFPASGIRLEQLKDVIMDLVANKILLPGDSEYTSPCFFVSKKSDDGKKAEKGRLCYDYRKINEYIKPKQFPLTSYSNFFENAAKFRIFCVIDICNAFLSIPLDEESKKFLAISTPFGVFIPQRTPFGLKTSPSAFCYAIAKCIGDLKFLSYYMDDLLIGACSDDEMVENLIIVFERLAKFNLKIRITKTQFWQNEIKVLGTIFSSTGQRIDPERIKAIKNFGPIDT